MMKNNNFTKEGLVRVTDWNKFYKDIDKYCRDISKAVGPALITDSYGDVSREILELWRRLEEARLGD